MDRRRIVGSWVALGLALAAPTAHAQTPTAPGTAPDETPSAPDETPAAPATAPAGRPKVAVVIVGDPDPEAIALAERVTSIVAADASMTGVSSSDLRAAMRGAPAPTEPDGLDDVRRLRASLSGEESDDVEGLVRLGTRAGADAVVLVRRREGAYEAVVLDVSRRSYFAGAYRDGGADRASEDARLSRLVLARAEQAFAARATGTATTRRAPGPARAGTAATRARPARASATATERRRSGADRTRRAPRRRESSSWIERTWPYFAAAALAGGFVGLYFLGREDDEAEPLRLRFVPSSSSEAGASP
ncbi:MAG: hypothetical protein IT379_18910 [Deltaproteobacteria bacterium]|nr:hypothetical protein [Deltaproteobacteria bacterium]